VTSGRLVCFDATPLQVERRSGVGHYVANQLDALIAAGGWRYALVASRRLRGWIPPGTEGHVGVRFPNRSIWMQLLLPAIIGRLDPAVCQFSNSLAPLACPRPHVVIIYDMSLFLHPGTQTAATHLAVRTLLPRIARRADALLTVSESARRDIVEVLRVDPAKVHVISSAPAPMFRPVEDGEALDRVRRKYDLGDPYVLAVGTIEPRKNLTRLIDAYRILAARGRAERLVIAGQLGWKYGGFLRRLEQSGLHDRVRLLGYVPDEDLPALYTLARALAFPSLYEGFGLPVVEAMACGTPVVTSNRSAMLEVAQGAALLVDPMSAEDIAGGIDRVLRDESLRDALRASGLARAASYTWPCVARRTLAVYEQVLGRVVR
jgi:glycosyltransferase involved in cell wall biosynthesis